MNSQPKIALIGAGSAVFSLMTFVDIVSSSHLEGCEVSLMDINEERLKFASKVLNRLLTDSKMKVRISSTTNLKEALESADFVIISIEKDRWHTWKLDWEIPVKYGIKQVIGECGGPGGLMHTLRIVPDILEICRNMEDVCPRALLLNYSNPEGRLCLAITRYSKIKAVGFCPGIYEQLISLSEVMGVDPEKLDARAYGLNHFTWIKELRFKDGKDAYPLLRESLKRNPDFQPLCRTLFETFGLYPSPSDNHVGEYLAYGWELTPESIRGINWIEEHKRWTDKMLVYAERIASGVLSLESLRQILKEQKLHIVRGHAIDLIKAITANIQYFELAINIPNQGNITNLPQNAIVEVPAVIDRSGIYGLSMGDLPKPIAALCNLQITIQELAVEAAVEGSKEKALQSLLIDPVVNSVNAAKEALDKLLNVQSEYLNQF